MTTQNMQIAHAAVTVGAATTAAAAANDKREYLLLENDGAETIYVAFGVAAVLNQGIRLNAGGGSFEMSRINSNMDVRAINAISASGGQTLLVSEG